MIPVRHNLRTFPVVELVEHILHIGSVQNLFRRFKQLDCIFQLSPDFFQMLAEYGEPTECD